MQIQVLVQCFWLNWSHSQVQILFCQQPSQAAEWHHSQRICPRWAERIFPVPGQKKQTKTWENKCPCFTVLPDPTELVHLKWLIQLRSCMCAVKVIVFPVTNPYSIPSLKLWPSFLSFLHFLTASQVPQNPVQHSLRHCHVLGSQSFKCRIIPWIYGWGSDHRDLASWVVTTQHSRSFISPGRGRVGKAVRMMNLRALKCRGTSYWSLLQTSTVNFLLLY